MRIGSSWDRVICNTGPVVGLHSIGRLELLTQLIPEIVVPSVVVDELRAGMGAGDVALQHWLQAVTVCEPIAPIDPFLGCHELLFPRCHPNFRAMARGLEMRTGSTSAPASMRASVSAGMSTTWRSEESRILQPANALSATM